jgi:hypothetical protein
MTGGNCGAVGAAVRFGLGFAYGGGQTPDGHGSDWEKAAAH